MLSHNHLIQSPSFSSSSILQIVYLFLQPSFFSFCGSFNVHVEGLMTNVTNMNFDRDMFTPTQISFPLIFFKLFHFANVYLFLQPSFLSFCGSFNVHLESMIMTNVTNINFDRDMFPHTQMSFLHSFSFPNSSILQTYTLSFYLYSPLPVIHLMCKFKQIWRMHSKVTTIQSFYDSL